MTEQAAYVACPERDESGACCLWEQGHLQDHLFPVRLTEAEWESYREAVLSRTDPSPSAPSPTREDDA